MPRPRRQPAGPELGVSHRLGTPPAPRRSESGAAAAPRNAAAATASAGPPLQRDDPPAGSVPLQRDRLVSGGRKRRETRALRAVVPHHDRELARGVRRGVPLPSLPAGQLSQQGKGARRKPLGGTPRRPEPHARVAAHRAGRADRSRRSA